jgi:hypothetical protein
MEETSLYAKVHAAVGQGPSGSTTKFFRFG